MFGHDRTAATLVERANHRFRSAPRSAVLAGGTPGARSRCRRRRYHGLRTAGAGIDAVSASTGSSGPREPDDWFSRREPAPPPLLALVEQVEAGKQAHRHLADDGVTIAALTQGWPMRCSLGRRT